jgi:hypothetical protein
MLELSILLIVRTTTEALAQSRSFYDGTGRIADRSTTDSSGATPLYDAAGRNPRDARFSCPEIGLTASMSRFPPNPTNPPGQLGGFFHATSATSSA